jgi:hypothetical protein
MCRRQTDAYITHVYSGGLTESAVIYMIEILTSRHSHEFRVAIYLSA